MDRAEVDQIERVINHELRERFTADAVRRAVLLQHADEPEIPPGQLMVRVFLPVPSEPGEYEQALTAWQEAHRTGMETFRRELSLRLPAARLLEFAFEGADPSAPRIAMPDDGTLAAEQMSGHEIVTTALSLLRTNYVFPELAEQAAIAVEARLTAGEYDNLDEITLTDLLTRHLREICEDKHLAVRLGGGPGPGAPGPRPGAPGPRPGGPGARRPGHGPERDEPKDHEARQLAMRQMGGWTTSASAGSSGWKATSAISICAGYPCRPTPARPSRQRWSSSPAPTRSSSTCGTTGAARRKVSSSGAATCSPNGRLTSTTSFMPIPVRPGSSGHCPTCRAPATSTAPSTC